MQQVIAEARQHAGQQAPHPDRPQQVGQERHAQDQPARDRQAALAQALQDAAGHHRIDQAAHGVHRHQRARRGQRDIEAFMLVGRREGQGAEHQQPFHEHRGQHDAGPGRAQHQPGLRHETLARRARIHLPQARGLLAAHFQEQQHAHYQVAADQRGKGPAPAHGVGEQAAGQLAGRHAQDGAGQEARQRRLAAFVRDVVADPGHGQRHDARPRRARQDAAEHQHVQRVGRHGAGAARGAGEGGEADDAVLAVAVAQRTEEHLQHAIGHGERRHRARGLAGGGAEFRRQLRQHGITDAEGAGADEGGQGKQRDGARFGGQGRHG